MRRKTVARQPILKCSALMIACMLIGACTTGSVSVGFNHTELVYEGGDSNGWGLGASIGLEFSSDEMEAISTCARGSVIFADSMLERRLRPENQHQLDSGSSLHGNRAG